MRFLCLAYEEEQDFDSLSRGEWEALRQETLDYVESIRKSGHLIDTLPLQSATRARTVQVRDGRRAVTDGPFTETREQLGGYFLIEAADFDEAVEIASNWPSARIGTIEVRPVEEGLPRERRYV